MNDLIINGIDHSVFDIEWAKLGGTLAIVDSPSNKVRNLGVYVRGDESESVKPYIRSLQADGIAPAEYGYAAFLDLCDGKSVTTILGEHIHLRMATPEECADAGVEYIEPPMIWRDIESAPKNQLILLLQHTLSYGDCIYSGAYVDGEWLDYTGKVHNSPHLWMPRPQQPKDE